MVLPVFYGIFAGAAGGMTYAGYFAGGDASTDRVDRFAFSDDSRTTLATGLSAARYGGGGAGNAGVAGYAFGPNSSTVCDKFAFVNDSRSVLTFPTMSCQQGGAANSGVAGYVQDASAFRKFPFATDTVGTAFAYAAVSVTGGAAMANSGTAYYQGGGYSGVWPGNLKTIYKILFSDDSISTLSSTLSGERENMGAAANSGTAGYWYGGNVSTGYARQTTVDKITFATDAVSTLGTGLSVAVNYTSSMANSGVAGYNGGGYASPRVTTVDKFAFPGDGRSTLGTGLSSATSGSMMFANAEALV